MEELAGLPGERAADDERDSAACADLIEEDLGAELEGGEKLAGAVALYCAVVDGDINHVAVREGAYVHLDRERTGVLHGVEENRSDLSAEDKAACPLAGNVRDVIADEPDD